MFITDEISCFAVNDRILKPYYLILISGFNNVMRL